MSSIPGLGWAIKPSFQLGKNTLAVPMKLHLAARLKVIDEMKKKDVLSGLLLFCGGKEKNAYDSDHEILFKYLNVIYSVV